MRSPDATRTAAAVVALAREQQFTVTAAGLAYYLFNTLLPLLLAYVGLTAFGPVEAVVRWVAGAAGVGPSVVGRVIRTGGAVGRFRAVAISVVLLVWSAGQTFQAVNATFTDIYGERKRQTAAGVLADVGLAFGTVVAALVLLGALVWTVSDVVVRLYATTAESVEVYGVVGGVLLVLAGVALNAVLAGRVRPDADRVPTIES